MEATPSNPLNSARNSENLPTSPTKPSQKVMTESQKKTNDVAKFAEPVSTSKEKKTSIDLQKTPSESSNKVSAVFHQGNEPSSSMSLGVTSKRKVGEENSLKREMIKNLTLASKGELLREISQSLGFMINGENFSVQDPVTILNALKEKLGKQFEEIKGIFQFTMYKDFIEKLAMAKQEAGLHFSNEKIPQAYWEVVVTKEDIQVVFMRPFIFVDADHQPSEVVAFKRVIVFDKKEMSKVYVKDYDYSQTLVQGKFSATIGLAIQGLLIADLPAKELTSSYEVFSTSESKPHYHSDTIEQFITKAMQRLEQRLLLIEEAISEFGEEETNEKKGLEEKKAAVISFMNRLQNIDMIKALLKEFEEFNEKLQKTTKEVVALYLEKEAVKIEISLKETLISKQLESLYSTEAPINKEMIEDKMLATKENNRLYHIKLNALSKQAKKIDDSIASKKLEIDEISWGLDSSKKSREAVIETLSESLNYVPIQEFRGEKRLSFGGKQACIQLMRGIDLSGVPYKMNIIEVNKKRFSVPHQTYIDLKRIGSIKVGKTTFPPLPEKDIPAQKAMEKIYEALKAVTGEAKLGQVLQVIQQGLLVDMTKNVLEMTEFEKDYPSHLVSGGLQKWEVIKNRENIHISFIAPFELIRMSKDGDLEKFGVIGAKREIVIQMNESDTPIKSDEIRVIDTFSAFHSLEAGKLADQEKKAIKSLQN